MLHLRKNKTKLLVVILTLLPISIFILLTLSSLSLTNHHSNQTIHNQTRRQLVATSLCDGTLHRDLCESTLSTLPDLHHKSLPAIISANVNLTVGEARASKLNCSRILNKLRRKLGPLEQRALNDCLELLDDTVSQLRTSLSDLSHQSNIVDNFPYLQTLLSAAMTNEATCLDGFAYSKTNIRRSIERRIVKISHHVSNSLAMLNKIPGVHKTLGEGEMLPGYGKLNNGFPSWLSEKDKKLLIEPIKATAYNLTVAQDGSGNYKTIGEALAAAPNSSTTRFVIYIKAGAYYEYIEVIRRKTNIMFLGDGIGKTLIKGNRYNGDIWTTFTSFTVAALGTGFIAKGVTIENYAGPSMNQAVALRVNADLSAFYQCSFVAYQDTLYVHSLRQFYRDCDVYGTVDFIFGNAAVVFQNCNLYARKPNPKQQNLFTAQGRDDPNQNTGISILNCKIAAGSELIPELANFKNYLGRPWKNFSRTVILLSNIEGLIDPAGWLEWKGEPEFANTLYYGEYKNVGAGANTTGRVTWPGYRVIKNETEASMFTVGNFIQGGDWLTSYGIPYYLGLTS